MSGIDNIFKNLKDLADLQAYARAQFNTITELTRKLNKAQDEIEHLKALLVQNPPVEKNNGEILTLDTNLDTTDQETICRIQLNKLKDKSIRGDELTLEETKRVEIYTKLLISLNPKKKEHNLSEKLPTEDLLKLVKGLGDGE